MSLAERSWPILRRLVGQHARIYRLTHGVIGHRFPGAPPMLLLDHVGARSARRRTTPLVYVEAGRDVVVVASKGGNPRHPAWYHNLRANPDTTVQIGAERRAVHARVATAKERVRLWPAAVTTYSGYRGYQARTDREIPLVILEPRARDGNGPSRPRRSPGQSTAPHVGDPAVGRAGQSTDGEL
jgi:F420H(2)-dependent quinone reductase